MKKSERFDNILDDCFERVLFGGETIEQCLQSYPDLVTELEPLLRMALATQEASNIQPDAEFRARAGYQFRSALEEAQLKRRYWWQSRLVTVATVFVALILLMGGTAAAARNSMPGGILYSVKLATEQVRLALTPSALGKAEVYASLADTRVSEIVYAAGKGDSEQVEQVTQRLSSHLDSMASLAETQLEQDSKAMLAPAAVPAPTYTSTPVPTPTPAPTQTPTLTSPSEETWENATPVTPVPRAGGESDKEDFSQVDERSELRIIVQDYATSHPALLRAALATAPESVKAALEQSIIISETGYEKVLQAIE